MRVRTYTYTLTLLLVLVATAEACNVTIGPTSTLAAEIATAATTATPAPLLVCLTEGYFTGCGIDLQTTGGYRVSLQGAGKNKTVVDCQSREWFAAVAYDDTALTNFTVLNTYAAYASMLDVPTGSIVMRSVVVRNSTWYSTTALTNGGTIDVASGTGNVFVDCEFYGNIGADGAETRSTVINLSGSGGAIHDCIFAGNGRSTGPFQGYTVGCLGQVSVTGSTFIGNHAFAGYVDILGGPGSVIDSCSFRNSVGGDRGAVFLDAGSTLTNCEFANTSSYSGCAATVLDTTVNNVTSRGSTFYNSGTFHVFLSNGGEVSNVTIIDAIAFTSPGLLITLQNIPHADVYIRDSAFVNCESSFSHGAVYFDFSLPNFSVYIDGSDFIGSYLNDDGGAGVSSSVHTVITDSVFAGNTLGPGASWGGSVYANGNLVVSGCIFADNVHEAGDIAGVATGGSGWRLIERTEFRDSSGGVLSGGSPASYNISDVTLTNIDGAFRVFDVSSIVAVSIERLRARNVSSLNYVFYLEFGIAGESATLSEVIVSDATSLVGNFYIEDGGPPTNVLVTRCTFVDTGAGALTLTTTGTVMLDSVEFFNTPLALSASSSQIDVGATNVSVAGDGSTLTRGFYLSGSGVVASIGGDCSFSGLYSSGYDAAVSVEAGAQVTVGTADGPVLNVRSFTFLVVFLRCTGSGSSLNVTNVHASGFNTDLDGFFVLTGFGVSVELANVTIEDCVGGGIGAVHVSQVAKFNATNILISDVTNYIYGAAIFATYCDAYFTNVTITNVHSDDIGGAIYVEDTDTVVTFNQLTVVGSSSNSAGGALACRYGSVCNIVNSSFIDNSADEEGGALCCNADGHCNLRGVFVSGCSSTLAGGGLASVDGSCDVTDSVFTACSAAIGGAVTVQEGASSSFVAVEFAENFADQNGGGIEVSGAGVNVTASIFTNNYAVSGGAVCVSSAAAPAVTSLVDCFMSGNTGTTAGSVVSCVSGGECYVTESTLRDNTGSAAIYGLFEAVLGVNSTAFAGNSHEGIAAYGAAGVDLYGVNFVGHGKPAIYCIASPMTVVGAVIRENTGLYAVWLSSARDVSFTDTFIAANSGTGFYCSAPKDGYATAFTNSLVCDNNPDFDCASGCSVAGVPNACSAVNATDCGRYCTEVNTDFCVADSGLFAGPYDGCFACGGECAAGNYSCPTHAVCEDTAGGDFDCACPTGFAGNGTTNCTDVDECVLGTHNCDVHASCVNTVGSFYCECDSGWEGSGVGCVDINECLTANLSVCVPGAACINIEGGHECECDDRYYGNGYVECSPCPVNAHSFVGATNLTDCECDTNTFNLAGTLGSDCVPCPPGKYVLFAQVLVCVDCPVDTYSTANNTVGACTPCPEFTSTYGASGLSSINNCSCSPGLDLVQYGSNNATRCERYCPAGTYRSTPAAPCFECVAGTYSENPNTQSCSLCPINRVTAGPGATSPNNCSCINGYFAPNGGVDEDCQRWCPAGSYRPNPFALDCILCDTGQYTETPNSPSCTDCPNNAVTTAQNATALEDCVCPANYYTPDRKVGTACVRCPEGAKCKGGVNWPVARKGFIVVESEDGTAEFAACVPSEACAGNGKCAAGYRGSLCERCEPNYYRLDGLCYECRDNAGVVVFFVALALFIFCAVLVWFNSQERALNKFASVVIGVNSLQIAAMYGRLNLHWPPFAQQFFAVLSLANFNIELVSPECAVTVSDPFVLRWLLTMFFPVVVALMFAAICGIGVALMQIRLSERWPGLADNRVLGSFFTSKWTPRYLRHTCIRAFYQLMTIGYLPLSAAVFEFFYCVKDANGTRVISTARQTACYTPVYWSLFPVALFCFFIYPVGIPVFCGFLLKTKRDKLGDIKFSIRYGFLVGRFVGEYYFFELAIMARKLGVAVAMSFLTDNSYVKAGGAVVVLVVSYTVQLRLTPYRTAVYNLMEDGCLLSSALVLLISVVFQAQGDGLELTRAVLVIVVLMGMLLIIVTGLAADAYAVYNAEREVDRMADETAETYNSAVRDEKEFDAVAAGTVDSFEWSKPQSVTETSVGDVGAEVATMKVGSATDAPTANAAYTGGVESAVTQESEVASVSEFAPSVVASGRSVGGEGESVVRGE